MKTFICIFVILFCSLQGIGQNFLVSNNDPKNNQELIKALLLPSEELKGAVNGELNACGCPEIMDLNVHEIVKICLGDKEVAIFNDVIFMTDTTTISNTFYPTFTFNSVNLIGFIWTSKETNMINNYTIMITNNYYPIKYPKYCLTTQGTIYEIVTNNTTNEIYTLVITTL